MKYCHMALSYALFSLLALCYALPLLAAEEPLGTGSGFVVSADGYLLTCFHVVKGATKVQVHLGDNVYNATVLGTDEKYDMALLQIPAKGLASLPLANSNAVDVGEEARAFGFPLADMLGADIKVTKGTISGISTRETQRVFQIDAPVNPGNSGGPLINMAGEVIGVVNAKLAAAVLDNIGFAVPINYAKSLLRDEGVEYTPGTATIQLDGPALVKRVSPAVALISVWGTVGGVTTASNPKDGAEMCLIPAGEFLMGSAVADDEQPPRKVYLDAYYIYKTEVTVAQYRQFCAETRRAMPNEPAWGWRENHPVVNVNWKDATAYARWAGATLPTEAQWEKAARGTTGLTYPWGNVWDVGKAQCSSARYGDADGPAPVGSFPAGASPFGVLDMAGNVWEWCADWYGEDYYRRAPANNPLGPATGTFRVLRGGSWGNNNSAHFRVSFRRNGDPTFGNYVFGFRCVSRSPGQ